jgi:hypothetical protein
MEPFWVQSVLWGLPELPRRCTICRRVLPAGAFRICRGVRHVECNHCHRDRNGVYHDAGTSKGFAPDRREQLGQPRELPRGK